MALMWAPLPQLLQGCADKVDGHDLESSPENIVVGGITSD